MKLYHFPLSPNARRALLVARHLKLELEEQLVDIAKGEQRSPEYLKLNPNGVVPTLVDGDFVLTESRVIAQYLAAQDQGSGLWPTDLKERFDGNRWAIWDAAHFSVPPRTIAYEKFIKAMFGLGEPDPNVLTEAHKTFGRYASVLDQRLAASEWVVGGRLTVADFILGASLTHAERSELDLGPHRHVSAWLGRLRELPAWKETEPQFG